MRAIKGRAVVASLLCAASTFAFGSGSARSAGPTTVTYSGSPDAGAEIVVEAAPGTSNRVLMALLLPAVQKVLEDEAGIVAPDSPHCTQESGTKVVCDATGLRQVTVNLGDGDDSLQIVVDPVNRDVVYLVDAGAGDDVLTLELKESLVTSIIVSGAAGNDRIELEGSGTAKGQAGNDRLIGGIGDQSLFGGAGHDILIGGKGANDRCRAGGGRDAGGQGCESTRSIP